MAILSHFLPLWLICWVESRRMWCFKELYGEDRQEKGDSFIVHWWHHQSRNLAKPQHMLMFFGHILRLKINLDKRTLLGINVSRESGPLNWIGLLLRVHRIVSYFVLRSPSREKPKPLSFWDLVLNKISWCLQGG